MDNKSAELAIQFGAQFWESPEEKRMIRVISPTEAIVIQVLGRDISVCFCHRHERVTFDNQAGLVEALTGMQEADIGRWEDLMNEYLQVTKVKLELMNEYRQAKYEKGTLR